MLRLGRRRRPRRTVNPAPKRQCRLRWPAVVCRGGGREPAGGGPFGPSGQRRPAQPAALPLALPDLRARRVQLICQPPCGAATKLTAATAQVPAAQLLGGHSSRQTWTAGRSRSRTKPPPRSARCAALSPPIPAAGHLHPCCRPPSSMPRVGGSAPISYLPTYQPLNTGNRRSCCGEPGPRSGRPADPSR